MKPTFVGIGAQKCASTWLYRILAEHPDVCVSAEKEVDFFSWHFDHGYQWYEDKFTDETASVCGEISPSYFCEPSVPQRIAAYAPDIKILLCLRDPIARALSNHRHEVRTGHLTGGDLSFERGLANNPMYIEQGLYATHLQRWLQHFSADRIHVVLMDDIRARPEEVAAGTYGFLGIDTGYVPDGLGTSFNRSYANRSLGVARLKDGIYGATQSLGLGWLWDGAAKLGLKQLYRRFNTVESKQAIPEPTAETLVKLRETFTPEVRQLETLLNRNLDSWLA